MKVLKMKYGRSGEKVDAFGIRFYADFASQTQCLGIINEIYPDPDVPPLTKNRRITLWFMLEEIRRYNDLSDYLDMLRSILRKEGFEIVISSIDNLVDTTSPVYTRKPESKFPASRRIHGYNAASGFSVTAEKTDAEPKFSIKEIETIQELAIKFGQTVYGRSLKKLI
jgi:hypothetical protein